MEEPLTLFVFFFNFFLNMVSWELANAMVYPSVDEIRCLCIRKYNAFPALRSIKSNLFILYPSQWEALASSAPKLRSIELTMDVLRLVRPEGVDTDAPNAQKRFTSIAKIRQLRELSISWKGGLSAAHALAMAPLGKANQLQIVRFKNLDNVTIPDALTNITHIEIGDTQESTDIMRTKSAGTLAKCTRLQSIAVTSATSGFQRSVFGKLPPQLLSKITSITLDSETTAIEFLSKLEIRDNVEHISLSCHLSPALVDLVSNAPKLKTLHWHNEKLVAEIAAFGFARFCQELPEQLRFAVRQLVVGEYPGAFQAISHFPNLAHFGVTTTPRYLLNLRMNEVHFHCVVFCAVCL
jgi:hypothetical protein